MEIKAIPAGQIMEQEKGLLKTAFQNFPSLPLEDIDKIFEDKYPSYAHYKEGFNPRQTKDEIMTYKK